MLKIFNLINQIIKVNKMISLHKNNEIIQQQYKARKIDYIKELKSLLKIPIKKQPPIKNVPTNEIPKNIRKYNTPN